MPFPYISKDLQVHELALSVMYAHVDGNLVIEEVCDGFYAGYILLNNMQRKALSCYRVIQKYCSTVFTTAHPVQSSKRELNMNSTE